MPSVEKDLPWDDVTRAVARAVVQHLPDSTATEAYYQLVMQRLAVVLWRLGAGHLAVEALGSVLRKSAREVRSRLNDATGISE